MAKANADEQRDRRFWGALLLMAGLFLGLSLFSYDWRDVTVFRTPANDPTVNWFGVVGAWASLVLLATLGLGAFVVPFWCAWFGVCLLVRHEDRVWPRAAWGAAQLLSLVCVLEIRRAGWAEACDHMNLADPGGLVGWLLGTCVLIRWLSPVGTAVLCVSLLAVSTAFFAGPATLAAIGRGAMALWRHGSGWLQERRRLADERQGELEREQREIEKRRRELEREVRRQERISRALSKGEPRTAPAEPEPVIAVEPGVGLELVEVTEPPEDDGDGGREPEPPPAAPPPRPPEPPPERAPRRPRPETGPETKAEPRAEDGIRVPPPPTDFRLPAMDLLDAVPKNRPLASSADVETTSRILKETLAEFDIEADVINVETGPVVTSYELLPAPGVRVERIQSLSNNLALALKATSVRVQAPIPGKGVVGIEVPNLKASVVYLREVLEGDLWRSGKAKLPLALGKDVSGQDIVADLAEMPHLLVAGATGSGKTVCMNSILAGLLMSRTPQDLRLMLVDPKIVEFSAYNHLPHLVVPVVTDPKKVAIGLRWAINEMEKRYKLFARVGVRNIESYNRREIVKQETLFQEPESGEAADEPPARIPYIVIVIDELADLMLTAQAEIENCVARLAQLSRAVGIHMIIATQRPSVNVITGTIKANFPARIAFQVAQKVDSRTILDTVGADKLLGRGDMLFLAAGSSKLARAQGALTTDAEIRRIVDHIKGQGEPDYELDIRPTAEGDAPESLDGAEDELVVKQAIAILRETHRASTSSLQRRLRIGYTRAARIMDILEERGIVGPPRGSDPREILIDLDGGIPNNPGDAEDRSG